MDKRKFDFSGWATRFNIKCADGRIIKHQAFNNADGKTVPLVWNHQHDSAENVVGHALLETRAEGVYAYASFNDSPAGQHAKELVKHGDVTALSIYANKLKQEKNGEVTHGVIRELSLVLAGANPGAYITDVMIHGEGENEEKETVIFNTENDTFELNHADGQPDEKKETDKNPKEEVNMEKEKTVQDVLNEMTEEQRNVVYAMIGMALEEKEKEQSEEKQMKHNAFENETDNIGGVLSHSEIESIFKDAKTGGSLKEVAERVFKESAIKHGIEGVENIMIESSHVNGGRPELINRDTTWVTKVLSAVKKHPLANIRSTYIDLTEEDVRAKGYVKGAQKASSVITALKRVTTPQTIYKLEKLHRDDVLDINDFDVVSFVKQDLAVKLDEELARAILIGDGRQPSDANKINVANIRPILGDDPTYVTNMEMELTNGETDEQFAKRLIKSIIKNRKQYKGSGNPTLFTTEEHLTNMLLIEDANGRVIYDSVEKLATTLRVKEIVTVEAMENHFRTSDDDQFDFYPLAVVVNLADYATGNNKGGEKSFFEDFDLNFNKLEYLLETRKSGALIKPRSALTFELKKAHANG